MAIKCPKGMILREKAARTGTVHDKKSKSNRQSTECVVDLNVPNKPPVKLPDLDDKISFRRYGYSVHDGEKKRRVALKRAFQDNNPLEVYRRLVLITNKQAKNSPNKETFLQDKEYLKRLYRNHKKTQRGGNDAFVTMQHRKIIISNYGNGNRQEYIYERYETPELEIVFATLLPEDRDAIRELLSQKYSSNEVMELLQKYQHRKMLGLFIDNSLCGIVIYHNSESNTKEIVVDLFFAKSGWRMLLLECIKRLFRRQGIKTLTIRQNLSINTGSDLKFWNRKGLLVTGQDKGFVFQTEL